MANTNFLDTLTRYKAGVSKKFENVSKNDVSKNAVSKKNVSKQA